MHVLRRLVPGCLLSTLLVAVAVLGPGAGPAAASGISLVGAKAGPKASAGKLKLPKPAGVKAGDVLVVGIAEHEVGVQSPPSGWKLIRRDAASADVWLWIYDRVATSSEPSTYVWSVGDPKANAAILAYRGVSTRNPVVDSSGNPNVQGTSASIKAPSVHALAGSVVVMFTMVEGPSPNQVSAPSGFTKETERGVHPSTASFDMRVSKAGPTGDKIAKARFGGPRVGWIGAMVSLRPA